MPYYKFIKNRQKSSIDQPAVIGIFINVPNYCIYIYICNPFREVESQEYWINIKQKQKKTWRLSMSPDPLPISAQAPPARGSPWGIARPVSRPARAATWWVPAKCNMNPEKWGRNPYLSQLIRSCLMVCTSHKGLWFWGCFFFSFYHTHTLSYVEILWIIRQKYTYRDSPPVDV